MVKLRVDNQLEGIFAKFTVLTLSKIMFARTNRKQQK